jgi:hypothetical protein
MSHRNRAFDDEHDETTDRNSVEMIHPISKKIHPHAVEGVNLSKFVTFSKFIITKKFINFSTFLFRLINSTD